MELKAVQNKTDNDVVELWSSDRNREYLAGTMHIDNFTGPVNERICEGRPVQLHVEISQPNAYELLRLMAEAGFDELDSDSRKTAVTSLKWVIADLALYGWDYEKMKEDML